MRQSRIVLLLLLCLITSLMSGCPDVPKDSPNPDGIRSCPPDCICEETENSYTVNCSGGEEAPQMLQ